MKISGWDEAAGAGQQFWELCSSSREWVMEMPQISGFHFQFSSFEVTPCEIWESDLLWSSQIWLQEEKG